MKSPSDNKLIYCFHLIIFLGAFDISAIYVGNINVRLTWLLIPFLYLFVPNIKHNVYHLLFIFIFIGGHVISSIISENILSGFFYSIWLLYNYLFFFRLAYICTINIKENIYDLIIINSRLQIIFAATLVLFGFQERANFIYYEPSYMAMALIPYVITIAFSLKARYLDYLLIIFYFLASQSANFMMVIVLAIFLRLFSDINFKSFFKILFFILTFVFLLVFYLKLNPNNINFDLFERIYTSSSIEEIFVAVIDRGGNRIPRLLIALDVFKENFLFGIGYGNFIDYVNKFTHMNYQYEYPQYDLSDQIPTNIFIEAGLNSGLLGLISLLVIFIMTFYKSLNINSKIYKVIGSKIIITIFTVMLFDSNYLRAYFWIFFGIICAHIKMRSMNVENN